MSSLYFLNNPVLRPEWLDGHPAYECDDGALVRAYMRMLRASVKAATPGALPSAAAGLAAASGLSEADVIGNWDVLTHGWVLLADGNLHHEGVAKHCAEILEQFSEEIGEIHARIDALGGLLELTSGADVSRVKKAKRTTGGLKSLPKGFDLTDAHVDWLISQRDIRSSFHHRYLMDKFLDYAKSKSPRYADWDAAFRNNVDMILGSRPLPAAPASEGVANQGSVFSAPSFPSYGGAPHRPVFGARSRQAVQQDQVRAESSGAFGRAQVRAAAREERYAPR